MPVARGDVDVLVQSWRENGWDWFPFEVKATRRGLKPVDLHEVVNLAIDDANRAAQPRVPNDPTWCSPADPGAGTLAAEIAEGVFTETELSAWLADFVDALERRDLPLRLLAPKPAKRAPLLDGWSDEPATPTVFGYLSAEAMHHALGIGSLRPKALAEVFPALESWVLRPGGLTTVSVGVRTVVARPSRVEGEVRDGLRSDPQVQFAWLTQQPPRYRKVDFSRYETFIQVFDRSRSGADLLEDVLEPMVTMAPYMDYAYIRRAAVVIPHWQDTDYALGRPQSLGEGLAAHHQRWRKDEFVPDPYVAQILTDSHLERVDDLTDFDVRDLGNRRHLVTARDPEQWITGLNPTDAALARARQQFAGILLTEERLNSLDRL